MRAASRRRERYEGACEHRVSASGISGQPSIGQWSPAQAAGGQRGSWINQIALTRNVGSRTGTLRRSGLLDKVNMATQDLLQDVGLVGAAKRRLALMEMSMSRSQAVMEGGDRLDQHASVAPGPQREGPLPTLQQQQQRLGAEQSEASSLMQEEDSGTFSELPSLSTQQHFYPSAVPPSRDGAVSHPSPIHSSIHLNNNNNLCIIPPPPK
jgi:hypothetical protein